MLSGLLQSKPLWDSWFQSTHNGNGVLAKAEALAAAKNKALHHGAAPNSMAKWDKPSNCWFNQQKCMDWM